MRRVSQADIALAFLSWNLTPAEQAQRAAEDEYWDRRRDELLAEDQTQRDADADARIFARMRAEDDAGERGRP